MDSAKAMRQVMAAGGCEARRFSATLLFDFMSTDVALCAGYTLRRGVPQALRVCAASIAAYVGRVFDHAVSDLVSAMYSVPTDHEFRDAVLLTWVRHHYATCEAFVYNTTAQPPTNALWVGYWAAGVECRRQIAIMSWEARVPHASQEPIGRLRALMTYVWPMYRTFTSNIVRAEAQARLDALVR